MIDVSGIDKAELLAALHNNTRPLGMGRLHDIGRNITVEEVRKELKGADVGHGIYVDYYHGRPIKIQLTESQINEWGYDREAGKGTFQRVVDELLEKLTTPGK